MASAAYPGAIDSMAILASDGPRVVLLPNSGRRLRKRCAAGNPVFSGANSMPVVTPEMARCSSFRVRRSRASICAGRGCLRDRGEADTLRFSRCRPDSGLHLVFLFGVLRTGRVLVFAVSGPPGPRLRPPRECSGARPHTPRPGALRQPRHHA